MHTHTRSIAHKVFGAWRSPDRFTKNPDIVRLESGRLLFVYSDTDFHWSQDLQIITVIASDDDGLTWYKLSEVDRASLSAGDERLVTPRLSLLSDGRLAVICDHDDFGHFHERQSPGNWIWWSTDGGTSWSEHQTNGIPGFEPDRIIELPDGRLAVGTHLMLEESQMYADVMSTSRDGGTTWSQESIIAHDGYHFFCEGALILLDGGTTLACVLRENRSAGIPCFVVFSKDMGKTWSEPQMCPFALHRPYAKQLADGRVFVTGRHVNGGLGTYGWVGDLEAEAGTYAVGGPRIDHSATLREGALRIENAPGRECAYTLLPPEDNRSSFHLEAELRIEADHDNEVAFLSTGKLSGDIIRIGRHSVFVRQGHFDRAYEVDMRQFHTVVIHHESGLLTVSVDGVEALRKPVIYEGRYVADASGGNREKRTQFGAVAETGVSEWRRVKYEAKNRTLNDFGWTWNASSGEYPDQYQRDRMIQIYANDPNQKPGPDHGYSSWLTLPDGRIILVDYTNCGDDWGKSHIVAVHIDPEDLK